MIISPKGTFKSHLYLTIVLVMCVIASINAREVIVSKDFGFDQIDATTFLQDAINSGAKKVIVSNMNKPWVISNPIDLVSNQEIYFEPGVEVVAKKGAFKESNASLFRAREVSNLTLSGYGATLKMQKEDYMDLEQYTKSEHRHALGIRSSTNVKIFGLTIRDSGGDGIYIGSSGGVQKNYCEDITIRDVICDNNYRQGISVISVKGLLIENCVLKDTDGTAPQAGIDFEPNRADQLLVDILVKDSVFENNSSCGIQFHFGKFDSTTRDVSVEIKDCLIKGGKKGGIYIGSVFQDGPKGEIKFVNCKIEDTPAFGIRLRNKALLSTKIIFEKCVLENTGFRYEAPIYFHLRDTVAAKCQGGVEFIDCIVKHDSTRPWFVVDEPSSKYGVYNITGNVTVFSPSPPVVSLGETEQDGFALTVSHNEHP